ncbi:hypothetical protein [Paracraurococcus ruber]|uniref:TetR family transcriptional regulator n=1 Tax=Paracraurococcus ruber TaxID=77675 RepID=A0ABS1D601_9PROT|nr:hypothetical protein [Paracraurococcus ruber]MBK1662143.1 hypothetical protein [Paracraurococcus ruber]TDG31155.1 hypothetical protein E2C05_11890 [Paracraurococcus ruber]
MGIRCPSRPRPGPPAGPESRIGRPGQRGVPDRWSLLTDQVQARVRLLLLDLSIGTLATLATNRNVRAAFLYLLESGGLLGCLPPGDQRIASGVLRMALDAALAELMPNAMATEDHHQRPS